MGGAIEMISIRLKEPNVIFYPTRRYLTQVSPQLRRLDFVLEKDPKYSARMRNWRGDLGYVGKAAFNVLIIFVMSWTFSHKCENWISCVRRHRGTDPNS
jgi:hypothetical protein